MAGAQLATLQSGPLGKRERYQQLRDSLWTERSTFDSHWKEIGDFLNPTRTRFQSTQRNQGGKRNQNIIDSTARFAWRTLRSGMHAGITSPARPWFKLSTPDPDLAEFKPVEEWLHVATQRMQTVFSSANLYNVLPVCYGDIGGWGTGAISILQDTKDLFRARHYPIGSYALALDARGVANTFVRDYELSVFQLVQEFGLEPDGRTIDWTKFSTTVKALWDQGQYTAPVQVTWVVTPNIDQDDYRIGSKFLPWSSCHFETGSDKNSVGNPNRFLRESGFQEFPIMAPRWEVTGEDTYGTDCPGMTVLGDIKQLQGMQKEKAKAVKKLVSPPMVGTPELRTQKTSILPGDITYVREPQHGFRAAHEVNLSLADLRLDLADTRYLIQRGFYEDLFLLITQSEDQQKTAREIEERHEEKLLVLGPVLEQMNDELLNPIIDRVYAMMERAELLPPPPAELDGVELKVEFTSILHEALKLVGVASLDRFTGSIIPILEVDPLARHKINTNRLIDNYGRALSVDPTIVRSDEEAEQLQQQEQQAQAQMAQAQAMKDQASAANQLANAPTDGDNALTRLAQAAQSNAIGQTTPTIQ
jgi:hypothetical protein